MVKLTKNQRKTANVLYREFRMLERSDANRTRPAATLGIARGARPWTSGQEFMRQALIGHMIGAGLDPQVAEQVYQDAMREATAVAFEQARYFADTFRYGYDRG